MLLFLLLATATATTDVSADSRLLELENRVRVLEQAVKQKVHGCQLVYKFHSFRLGRCTPGTFINSLTLITNGPPSVECGYYQLQCAE